MDDNQHIIGSNNTVGVNTVGVNTVGLNTVGVNTVDSKTLDSQQFDVTGMTCAHCVASVTEKVCELPGVTNVTVELHPGQVSRVVVATDTPVSSDAISRAIAEAGYAAVASS